MRYKKYNAHAEGYTWKRLGNILDMSKTLEENEIPDEAIALKDVGMNPDDWLPEIHLHFRYWNKRLIF
jgi:hypothetical protein